MDYEDDISAVFCVFDVVIDQLVVWVPRNSTLLKKNWFISATELLSYMFIIIFNS